MGEAKRRASQGLPPRQPRSSNGKAPKAKGSAAKDAERLYPWLPLSRQQADQFMAITTRGAWIGIAALVLFWVTVRFIGPAAGWWTLADT
jgi:hypothetical protein